MELRLIHNVIISEYKKCVWRRSARLTRYEILGRVFPANQLAVVLMTNPTMTDIKKYGHKNSKIHKQLSLTN